ncbi:hypothetical protein AB0E96_03910 [Kitasatospora sp. NPDC036755]
MCAETPFILLHRSYRADPVGIAAERQDDHDRGWRGRGRQIPLP